MNVSSVGELERGVPASSVSEKKKNWTSSVPEEILFFETSFGRRPFNPTNELSRGRVRMV